MVIFFEGQTTTAITTLTFVPTFDHLSVGGSIRGVHLEGAFSECWGNGTFL
jgi:hypothetical protein